MEQARCKNWAETNVLQIVAVRCVPFSYWCYWYEIQYYPRKRKQGHSLVGDEVYYTSASPLSNLTHDLHCPGRPEKLYPCFLAFVKFGKRCQYWPNSCDHATQAGPQYNVLYLPPSKNWNIKNKTTTQQLITLCWTLGSLPPPREGPGVVGAIHATTLASLSWGVLCGPSKLSQHHCSHTQCDQWGQEELLDLRPHWFF